MEERARIWEKSCCCYCRNSYHAGGHLGCVARFGSGNIPAAILSGDQGCELFKQIEKRAGPKNSDEYY